jgi:hypothetical protein
MEERAAQEADRQQDEEVAQAESADRTSDEMDNILGN